VRELAAQHGLPMAALRRALEELALIRRAACRAIR
jgi:hypothetical protein